MTFVHVYWCPDHQSIRTRTCHNREWRGRPQNLLKTYQVLAPTGRLMELPLVYSSERLAS